MRSSGRVRRRFLAVSALALVGAALAPVAPADASAGTTEFVASTVGVAPSAAALDRSLPPSIRVTEVAPLAAGLARITVRGTLEGASADAVSEALSATSRIGSAAPAARVRIAGAAAPVTASDEVFPDQWDLWDSASMQRAGGYGVDAPRAWQRTLGDPSVVVAVLDTGITGQRDLLGIHRVPGYDFVTQADGVTSGDGDDWDADPSDPGDACAGTSEPSSWHGTFVTGEIAGNRGRFGITGEAPGVSIEPVRVLGACGGSEADLITGIEWASGGTVPGVPANAHPARVLSISLGADSPEGCDAPLQQAIDDAWARGSSVVVAAGNDDAAMAGTAPADCAHVISVAATTRYGNRAAYSNFGTSAMSPTIAAPGGNELNPVWGDVWSSSGSIVATGNTSEIAGYMGTSMATPRVSAAIALLLSTQPALTPDDVRARLRATVTPYPAVTTCSITRCGPGIVNAGDLLGVAKRFVHVSRATVTGTARAGQVLALQTGELRPSATQLTYRWYRDGIATSVTGTRYAVRTADRGAVLTVRVTATRSGYAAAAFASLPRTVAR